MDAPTIALYDAHAAHWAASRGGPGDDIAERFRGQVGEGLILDAGCGVGRYLFALGSPTVGMDATTGMLELARAGRAPLTCGDLERLPFADQMFAGIFARHSYLHLPKDRASRAFGEAARLLRTGGRLLLTMICGDYEGRALSGDDIPGRLFTLWHADPLASTLATAGFSDVNVDEVESRRGSDLVATAVRRLRS